MKIWEELYSFIMKNIKKTLSSPKAANACISLLIVLFNKKGKMNLNEAKYIWENFQLCFKLSKNRIVKDDLCLENELQINLAYLMEILAKFASLFTKSISKKIIQDFILPFTNIGSQQERQFSIFMALSLLDFVSIPKEDWDKLASLLFTHSDEDTDQVRMSIFSGIGIIAKFGGQKFKKFEKPSLDILLPAIECETHTKIAGYVKDSASASLGKIIKYQQYLSDNEIIRKWLSLLPLKYDTDNQDEQEFILSSFLQENPKIICGNSYQNLDIIIEIILKIMKNPDSLLDDNKSKAAQSLKKIEEQGGKEKLKQVCLNLNPSKQKVIENLLQQQI